MNYSDLLVVIALGSGIYAILIAVAGQRYFLLNAVNPHRVTWLITGASVMWVGLSLMRWEAGGWDLKIWAELFAQLVSDKPTPPRVKVASVAILFGVLQLSLVGWCLVFHPRAPSTFRRPKDRQAAFRYYVRLRGGIDYALMACGDGERLLEEGDMKQIEQWVSHLPKVQIGDNPPRIRTAKDQIEFWRQAAVRIHQKMKELDEFTETAHQGHNRRIVFDCEFGAMFFRYVRPANPLLKFDTGLFIFGATLSQTEVLSGRAESHFQHLYEAMYHIENAIRTS